MAEPFSIVSASISLLDVSLRAIRETYKFISALRQASAELNYIHRHLAGLEKALIRIKALKQSYLTSSLATLHRSSFDALEEELKAFVQDLACLRKLLGNPESSAKHAFNRFGTRVKSVFREKELNQISERLDRRRLGMSEILSTIGRHNDLETQRSLKSIQEIQKSIRADLKASFTTSRLQLSAVDKTQRCMRREQLQLSQAVLQKISTHSHGISSMLDQQREHTDSMVAGFSTVSDRLSAIHSDGAASKEMIQHFAKHACTKLGKLDRLADIVENLNALHLTPVGDQVILTGSAQDAAASLSLLSTQFGKVVASVNQPSGNNPLSPSGAGNLFENLRSLLAKLYAQASHELASKKRQPDSLGRYRPSQPIALQNILKTRPSYVQTITSVLYYKNDSERLKVVEVQEIEIHVDLGSIGSVIVFRTKSDPSQSHEHNFGGFRALFFPRAELSVCGFAASFANDAPTPTMSPLLSTFGLLRADHDIWRFIQYGHINGVRDLLWNRRVHPNDRESDDGITLLGWAAYWHQLEIMQTLLLEGADPLDCNYF
ncbi:uncharacterized protein BDZ99DRAFT_529082 [Mytilinidion resinicola]|uniref:Fungal N-terminal domain-containing protein n=1 Tax=Mytilinidion resinicola TaxID=574789 RepID=A0A6A6Z7F0_9PEZI|nr:uncharacterized protein BDZ99DRAFT_529082 [Mytilinidion resinicola]KAF2816986.1 hypothetical protein BDZ99DRAFT_529082 [Mytilinidion resinicola]